MTRVNRGAPVPSRVRLRWGIAILCGIAVGIGGGMVLGPAAGLLAGWAVLALVNVAAALGEVWPMDAEATRAHATLEDPSHRIARFIAVLGSLASLGAVVIVVVQAGATTGGEALALAGIAVLSVVASWALIQTDYMLHYARLFYQPGPGCEPARGIDFNQDQDPEYTDFVYFSVGLGMTYQVADTSVGSNAIRRVVIAQTLLAYLFGAGILATVINLVVGIAANL